MRDPTCDASWSFWPYALLLCVAWIAWSLHTWVQVQRSIAKAQITATYLTSVGRLIEQAACAFRMYEDRRRPEEEWFGSDPGVSEMGST